VPAAGYELDELRVTGISRSNPAKALGAAARAAAAVPTARAILKRRAVDAVVGAGGYVSAPMGAAALLTRRPLILTEADSHLGLANRLLARRDAQ
jgi:UDP-N-acetylglucosamine--N-acetylmuramyl-(pentapeptide) pyrophosphoryl-undecaprenol N-acetylglucosamine transferase